MAKPGSPRSRRFDNSSPSIDKVVHLHGFGGDTMKLTSKVYGGKRKLCIRKHLRFIALTTVIMGLLFLLDSLMFSIFDSSHLQNSVIEMDDRGPSNANETNASVVMYDRLLNLASTALAEKESRSVQKSLWKEPPRASEWKPCAKSIPQVQDKPEVSNGFVLVSANGGLNQQRVAVCNAVAVASLLNATLVIPKFLYSNVWKDPSQFGDIYQEDYFINTLKNDVDIVKDLPSYMRTMDLEAIGSVITDSDLVKEATPEDYINLVLPILLRNSVVHFLGFGNRLGFDPLPSRLQKLRCKCDFHALKFSPKIQEIGSLLVRRIRKHDFSMNMLDKQLLGNSMQQQQQHPSKGQTKGNGPKYLALHLRFEEDMLAYSLCDFGGGEQERRGLHAYRQAHFPLLLERLKNSKTVTPSELRSSGRCPLTPEESALVLAGLGFSRGTYIYLAGSRIYGGQSRMKPFTTLYPNLVTKEDLLSPTELQPFTNFSSQLAALDFIACATADVFAMTDSGSQLSSLVSGFRAYFGAGKAPTLRPDKKSLAAILLHNSTIKWSTFEGEVKEMIEEQQSVHPRAFGQSLYRHPRTPECMCRR